MSVMPLPPSCSGPPRRPRRAAAAALLAGVVLLHAVLLGLLPRERPPAVRPGAAPMPALWTRTLPAWLSPPAAAPEAGAAPDERIAAAAARRPETAAPPIAVGRESAAPAASAATALPAEPIPEPPTAAAPDTAIAPRQAAADADSDEPDTPPAGGSPPPLYATRLPDPALLRYQLRRGPQHGQAQLRWQHDGAHYTLAFDAQAGERPLYEQRSTGRSGPQGLAPERFSDKRRGRTAQQAQFDADAGRITFSTRAPDLPLWPGAQDRLGWIVQLAGIVAAAPAPPEEVQLFVVGARGGAGPWTFVARGMVPLATPLGPVQALHYERAPAVLRDQRIEAWLDPARGHWPVRLRFSPVLGGPPLELWLDADPAKP